MPELVRAVDRQPAILDSMRIRTTAPVDPAQRRRIDGLISSVTDAAIQRQGLLQLHDGVVPPPLTDRYIARLIKSKLEIPQVPMTAVDRSELRANLFQRREITHKSRSDRKTVHRQRQRTLLVEDTG